MTLSGFAVLVDIPRVPLPGAGRFSARGCGWLPLYWPNTKAKEQLTTATKENAIHKIRFISMLPLKKGPISVHVSV